MLLRAGIPLKTTLGMVADILPVALRAGLLQAVADIEQGRPFSQAAERGGLTTPVALRMIAVGERSGQLGDMMEAVATFYDEEINRLVDSVYSPLRTLADDGDRRRHRWHRAASVHADLRTGRQFSVE